MSVLNRPNIASVASPNQVTRAIYHCRIPQGVIDMLSKKATVGNKGVGGVKSNIEHIDLAFSKSMIDVGRTIEGIAEAYSLYPSVEFDKILDIINIVYNFRKFIYALFERKPNTLFKLKLHKDQLEVLYMIADFINHLTEHHGEKLTMGLRKHYLKGDIIIPTPMNINKQEYANYLTLEYETIDIDDLYFIRNEGCI